MINIIHRVGIRAPLSKVYAALSTIDGIAGWWTAETTGISTPGETIHFAFNAPDGTLIGNISMQVLILEPDTEVRWRCTAGPEEWIGTDVVFKLACEDGYSIVHFAHRNWREAVDFTEHCSMKWATFLLSLKQLLETGQGSPAPDDLKIDNWN